MVAWIDELKCIQVEANAHVKFMWSSFEVGSNLKWNSLKPIISNNIL